jgi:hypothetical protein
VWLLSVLGFAVFSLYVVLSCGRLGYNLTSIVIFYFQISSFALIPQDDESASSNALLEYSQLQSFLSVSSRACFAPDMGAYGATAAKLIGPLFVLFFSFSWTWILLALQPRLLQRNIHLQVSYSGSIAEAALFSFSSVSQVVLTLVQCTRYDELGVVFIDGTVPCYDVRWKGLMLVVVLLCLSPIAFAAALWFNKLPPSARSVICRPFTDSAFFWGAVTLEFRLLISVLQLLQFNYPHVLALMRMLLCTGMLFLLLRLRPHIFQYTLYLDATCFICLIIQFGIQTFFAQLDFLAYSPSEPHHITFFADMAQLSLAFRC